MASFLDLQGLKRFYTNLTTKNVYFKNGATHVYVQGESVDTKTAVTGTGTDYANIVVSDDLFGSGIPAIANTATMKKDNITISKTSDDGIIQMSVSADGITYSNDTSTGVKPSADKVFASDGSFKDLSAYDKVVENVFPFKLSSFSVSPNIVEKGASTDVTFNWAYANSEHTINSQSIKIGSNLSSGAVTKTAAASLRTLKVVGADTATLFGTVQNLTCLMTATNAAGKSITSSTTVYVVNPSYYGILSSKTVPTSFTGLTKLLKTSAATTLSNVTLTNQYFIYMYPATYADLTSITDGVLPYLGAFDKGTTTIGGVSYKYYIKSTAGNITWSTLTFK